MKPIFNEDTLPESPAIEQLQRLGYEHIQGAALDPELKDVCERSSCREIILIPRLKKKLAGINPHLTEESINKAMRRITHIQHRNKQISYEIIRSNRKKTISIHVDSAGVSVRVPQRISEKDILSFVEKKASWILGKQEQIKQAMHLHPPKEFVSGESFPYLVHPEKPFNILILLDKLLFFA